jgi:DNA-directed RNA polymerase
MGDTPWRVNQRILDVVEMFYQEGGGLGEIPVVDTGDAFIPDPDLPFIKRWKMQKEKKDNWSLLSDFEIRLGIARSFRKIS